MDIQKFIQNHISEVLNSLEVSTAFEITESGGEYSVLIAGDDLSFLIGYRGESLYALQHLLNLALFNKFDDWVNVFVDINDYRSKKKEKLEDMTKGFIDRVRFFANDVEMPPMSSFERKIVHEFVAEYEDVESSSIGEGYNRHVVLRPLTT